MTFARSRTSSKWLWGLFALVIAVPMFPQTATANPMSNAIEVCDGLVACAAVEAFVEADAVAFTIENILTGRYLDADRDMSVDTSVIAKTDDRWYLVPAPDGSFLLRNGDLGTYLDIDANRGEVNQSFVARDDDFWTLEDAGAPGIFHVRSVSSRLYLETKGPEVLAARGRNRLKTQWRLTEAAPLPVSEFVGQAVAFENAETGQWLSEDRYANVKQTVRADNLWLIEDAGDGYVFVINQATGRPLDADRGAVNVTTSRLRRTDDRWRMLEEDGLITFRNVRFGGNLFGEGADRSFNATRRNILSMSTQWRSAGIELPAEVDMVFSIDLTGSMGGVLAQAKDEIGDVIANLEARAPSTDFRFSVVSYEDYPGVIDSSDCPFSSYNRMYGAAADRPFRINQTLSTDAASIVESVQSLRLGNGSDGPESYGRVFWEIGQADTGATLGFRESALKIIVNFGDNLPHDPDLNEGSDRRGVLDTGVDPGRNSAVDCGGDDIDFQDDALAALIDADIRLLHVDSGSVGQYWRPWARSTGGGYALLAERRITDVIIGLLGFPEGEEVSPAAVAAPTPAELPYLIEDNRSQS